MSLTRARQFFVKQLLSTPQQARGYLPAEKIPPHVFKVLKVKYPEVDHEFMYMDLRQYDNPILLLRWWGIGIFTAGLAMPLCIYYYSGRKKELV